MIHRDLTPLKKPRFTLWIRTNQKSPWKQPDQTVTDFFFPLTLRCNRFSAFFSHGFFNHSLCFRCVFSPVAIRLGSVTVVQEGLSALEIHELPTLGIHVSSLQFLGFTQFLASCCSLNLLANSFSFKVCLRAHYSLLSLDLLLFLPAWWCLRAREVSIFSVHLCALHLYLLSLPTLH